MRGVVRFQSCARGVVVFPRGVELGGEFRACHASRGLLNSRGEGGVFVVSH